MVALPISSRVLCFGGSLFCATAIFDRAGRAAESLYNLLVNGLWDLEAIMVCLRVGAGKPAGETTDGATGKAGKASKATGGATGTVMGCGGVPGKAAILRFNIHSGAVDVRQTYCIVNVTDNRVV